LHIGLLFCVALLLASGAYTALRDRRFSRLQGKIRELALDGVVRTFVALPLLALCMMMLALGQYNPFIYFRF
jgi:alginate O-acetyltransferase complex protein AlgI